MTISSFWLEYLWIIIPIPEKTGFLLKQGPESSQWNSPRGPYMVLSCCAVGTGGFLWMSLYICFLCRWASCLQARNFVVRLAMLFHRFTASSFLHFGDVQVCFLKQTLCSKSKKIQKSGVGYFFSSEFQTLNYLWISCEYLTGVCISNLCSSYQVDIWQVSLQFSCVVTCQTSMWCKRFKR